MADDRERLQALHIALEAALEQLTYAQQHAVSASEIGHEPPPEVHAIERALAEVTTVRNQVRERLMKALAKPTLNILR
jgi:hypothetical protein